MTEKIVFIKFDTDIDTEDVKNVSDQLRSVFATEASGLSVFGYCPPGGVSDHPQNAFIFIKSDGQKEDQVSEKIRKHTALKFEAFSL